MFDCRRLRVERGLKFPMDTVMMASLRLSRGAPRAHGLTAVAASEDSATDARINEFCSGLSHQLGNGLEMKHQIWLLSELRMPQLRAIAAQDAAAADVVMVALHHSEMLPEELNAWLDLWLNEKSKRTRMLLALFDPVYSGISAGLRLRLEEVAKQGHLEFLVHNADSADNG